MNEDRSPGAWREPPYDEKLGRRWEFYGLLNGHAHDRTTLWVRFPPDGHSVLFNIGDSAWSITSPLTPEQAQVLGRVLLRDDDNQSPPAPEPGPNPGYHENVLLARADEIAGDIRVIEEGFFKQLLGLFEAHPKEGTMKSEDQNEQPEARFAYGNAVARFRGNTESKQIYKGLAVNGKGGAALAINTGRLVPDIWLAMDIAERLNLGPNAFDRLAYWRAYKAACDSLAERAAEHLARVESHRIGNFKEYGEAVAQTILNSPAGQEIRKRAEGSTLLGLLQPGSVVYRSPGEAAIDQADRIAVVSNPDGSWSTYRGLVRVAHFDSSITNGQKYAELAAALLVKQREEAKHGG